jgi:hypothetical protein
MEELKKQLLSIVDINFAGLRFKSHIFEKEYHNDIFYIIGNDYENEIGIKKSNGEIFSLSKDDIVFINSSLSQLINCINLFVLKINFEESYVEDKRHKEMKGIKEEFEKIDKKALNEDCWWSYIIEETEDGLL